MNAEMKQKITKITSIVVNVLTVIICLFALTIAITAITAKSKGYNSIFGTAYHAVASDSMKGDKADNFAKGDVIKSKVLKDSEKTQLKVGDVITFLFLKDGSGDKELNTHRIIEIKMEQDKMFYVTKGDANTGVDAAWVDAEEDVVGLYKGKFNGIGNALLWMQGKTGFLVCVMIPSILILIYCIVLVVLNFTSYNKKKKYQEEAGSRELMAKEIREQLLAELKAEKNDTPKEDADAQNKEE